MEIEFAVHEGSYLVGAAAALKAVESNNETYKFGFISKHDLRLLRNTIFARYGYKFTAPDLKRHFTTFSWYNGNNVNARHGNSENGNNRQSVLSGISGNTP